VPKNKVSIGDTKKRIIINKWKAERKYLIYISYIGNTFLNQKCFIKNKNFIFAS